MEQVDVAAFEARLREEGYEVSTKTVEPSKVVSDHTHDFDVLALVTEGEITLAFEGKTERYRVGDHFALPRGCTHGELIGPDGVTFLVGRRTH